MSFFLRTSAVLLLVSLSPASALCQADKEKSEMEMVSLLNRLGTRFSMIHFERKNPESDLELTDLQDDLLARFHNRYQHAVRQYFVHKSKEVYEQQLVEFNEELDTEILLAPQVKLLDAKLFERQLTTFQKNYVRLIIYGYADKVNLNEKQATELKALDRQIQEKIKKAEKRYLDLRKQLMDSDDFNRKVKEGIKANEKQFAEELEKIGEESKNAAGKHLTPEQLKKLPAPDESNRA